MQGTTEHLHGSVGFVGHGILNGVDATTQIVAPVSGAKIRILSIFFLCSADMDVTFTNANGGDDISGVMPFKANSGPVLNHNICGWVESAVGDGIKVTPSAGEIDGMFVYQVVPADKTFSQPV